MQSRRMTATELDAVAAGLEAVELEDCELRETLRVQVEELASTAPRAENRSAL